MLNANKIPNAVLVTAMKMRYMERARAVNQMSAPQLPLIIMAGVTELNANITHNALRCIAPLENVAIPLKMIVRNQL